MKPSYEQLEQLVLDQQKIIAQLYKVIEGLQAKVAHLESKLNKNSRNSSMPPSLDSKPNRPKNGNSGQQGAYHPGVSRQLLPEGSVTNRERRGVDFCPHCQSPMEPTGKTTKWQQVDLPEIKPVVHEIELVTCKCTKCSFVKTPELQDHEIFLMGPRLEGFISLLIAQFRHSHGSVRAFIELLFPGLRLSQGLISKTKKRAANAFDQAAQELAEALLADKDPKHLDFTGWRHEGQNWNSLIIRNKTLLRYFLREKQSGKVVEEILNKGRHKIVCDRGLALGETDVELLQYCLAHLQRNFQGMAENEQITQEETQVLGEVYETLQMLFHDKHRYDRNEISLETFRQYGYQKWAWIKEELEILLECSLCVKLRRFCKKVLKGWKHFMVYLSQAGPMTNNLAEEGLRNLVIARKLCFGSRSSYGLKWRESVQSCVETLKRQGKSVLDFFAETIRAFRLGAPCPKIV